MHFSSIDLDVDLLFLVAPTLRATEAGVSEVRDRFSHGLGNAFLVQSCVGDDLHSTFSSSIGVIGFGGVPACLVLGGFAAPAMDLVGQGAPVDRSMIVWAEEGLAHSHDGFAGGIAIAEALETTLGGDLLENLLGNGPTGHRCRQVWRGVAE